MKTWIGTSGYAYKPWKGPFYPEKLPDAQMLSHYAGKLSTVEINNTFYRMPTTKMLEGWKAKVPEGFSFVIKASRRITHQGRLKPESVEESLGYLMKASETLGSQLGPFLFQLPPNFKKDAERLAGFLELLPSGRRAAMEFRNPSWFDEETYELLRGKNVALCYSDGEMKDDPPFVSTADWGYLRLRDGEYDEGSLVEWKKKIEAQSWKDAYVFFKHEDAGIGPKLALRLQEMFAA